MSIEVTLDFGSSLPDAMRFVPMNFRESNPSAWETNVRDSLQFTPAAFSEDFNQVCKLPNASAGCNRLDRLNRADDLKPRRHRRNPYRTFAFARMNSSTSFLNRACALRSMQTMWPVSK
jgi:hypothetical protein